MQRGVFGQGQKLCNINYLQDRLETYSQISVEVVIYEQKTSVLFIEYLASLS